MKREAYAAARTIAPKLQAYFARHRDEALSRGEQRLATVPDAATIEALIDAAFWASLRREEGYEPRISLAFLSPQEAQHPLLFERPMPLAPAGLTRVAPAVERPGIHLGVWRDRGELCVWGATQAIPVLCFVLEVAAPGLLVVKHHSGEELRKFINVAVLEGDQIKLVQECASHRPDSSPLLKQLAVSMRAHGRGGLLLIVPAGTGLWQESIVQPVPYSVSPPFSELAFLNSKTPDPAVAAIGGLTAVDGAVVLNNRYELLGFGAKIARRRGSSRVEQVTLTEPIEGVMPALVHLEQIGGTRHLSAAQFVHDQRDAVALVASQDGRFTVFEWSPAESLVHAHRIETLLL